MIESRSNSSKRGSFVSFPSEIHTWATLADGSNYTISNNPQARQPNKEGTGCRSRRCTMEPALATEPIYHMPSRRSSFLVKMRIKIQAVHSLGAIADTSRLLSDTLEVSMTGVLLVSSFPTHLKALWQVQISIRVI